VELKQVNESACRATVSALHALSFKMRHSPIRSGLAQLLMRLTEGIAVRLAIHPKALTLWRQPFRVVAGFWLGLWRGFIAPITSVLLLPC
jgi:hypothetical protein